MGRVSEVDARRGDGTPRVVILGGGYGGVYAALALRKAARKGKIDLVLVSRNNFFLFQPMLAEVVSGSIEPPHILNSIRRLIPFARFYKAEIEAISVESRTESRTVIIRYEGHADFIEMPYDHLVISVGSSTDLSSIPGVAEHAFPFRTMGDALLLRNHLIGVLEEAEVEENPSNMRELLTFVVAGGGYTGVEVAAEINDFVREAAGSYGRVDPEGVKVILVHSRGRILPELSEELAAFSHRLLVRHGIEVRLHTQIRGATAQSALTSEGAPIPTRTLVAAVGGAPNRVLDTTTFERDSRGRLVVDETLAVPGQPGVWALGDCAAIPDVKRRGETCPPTSQYALREGKQVAGNILATLRGGSPRPFAHRNLGVFVPLGRFSAAAQLSFRVLSFKVSGILAWWLYRTYHLSQLPRLDRKLKVLIDWTLDLVFRRGIVQMDVVSSEGISRAHYEAGNVIFRQGELARRFFIILGGEVQVFRQQDGAELPVATLRTGEFFGEMSLLKGGEHTASARALAPTDLLIMGGSDFRDLAKSSSRFDELLAGVMRQRQEANEASQVPKGGEAESPRGGPRVE